MYVCMYVCMGRGGLVVKSLTLEELSVGSNLGLSRVVSLDKTPFDFGRIECGFESWFEPRGVLGQDTLSPYCLLSINIKWK